MSVAVKTIPNRSATVAIGSWSGSVTYQNFFRPVAPSTLAASSTSVGIEARPARKITVANGMIRHECTAMTAAIASVGWPSHCGGANGSIGLISIQSGSPGRANSQLTALYGLNSGGPGITS